MCGIAGILSTSPAPQSHIKQMCDAMRHRGPDDSGGRVLAGGRLELGHRRLSILDLSKKGHQPMRRDGYWITYNGEVYNFEELRQELEADCQFTSTSDTEVVLRAYQRWGTSCFTRFNGMFAMAIWDPRKEMLVLARDRYGIKPLYWWSNANRLIFASEVKAILAAGVRARVDRLALDEYFTFQNCLDDRTLFDGIKMFPAGCYAEIKSPSSAQVYRYWDWQPRPTRADMGDAAREVRRLFEQAVGRQVVADVPVGAYLSGGMDTGSIVSLLPGVDTFTCGFDMESVSGMEMFCDEREQARKLVEHPEYHHEIALHAGDMEAVMPEVVRCLEDLRVGQCYPNYLIARFAAKHNKVVLAGTGGDEVFGGYPWRYRESMRAFPESCYRYWQRVIPAQDREQAFRQLAESDALPHNAFSFYANHNRPSADLDAVLRFEAKTFLHGILLVEDKVSMAHSLEVRVPFLDNDLVDFALTIPHDLKVNQDYTEGKLVLRKAFEGLLPEDVLHRSKQGFSAPDGTWFRGQSIEYVRKVLWDEKARIYEYLIPEYVHERLQRHFGGKVNERLFIWSCLCFELWLKEFIK